MLVLHDRRRLTLEKLTVRILVVDDFEPARRFVSSILRAHQEFQVVGEASDGLEGVQKFQELQPDLTLLDIGLPKLNGLEVARKIRACAPSAKIVFLSQESSIDLVQEALSTGAMGYVVKIDAESELLMALYAAARGEKFVGSRFVGHDFFASSD